MQPKKPPIPDVRLPTAKERIVECCRKIITADTTNNDTLFNNNVLWLIMAIDELNKHKTDVPF